MGYRETVAGYRGKDYRGFQTKTRTGRTCQNWMSMTPQHHTRTPNNFPNKGLGNHNNCRNPDNEDGGIWCYTTDSWKRWEYCNPVAALPGRGCSDIDECAVGAENSCGAHATCTNTAGSHTCACDDGYHGDGHSCSDINECAVGAENSCGAHATCTNTVGSHTCACDDGYSGDGQSCENINECAEGSHDCGANSVCSDTDGSFSCTCEDGFRSSPGGNDVATHDRRQVTSPGFAAGNRNGIDIEGVYELQPDMQINFYKRGHQEYQNGKKYWQRTNSGSTTGTMYLL